MGFVIGGYFGSKLALNLSENKLKKIFAVVLLVLSLKMLFLDKPKPEGNASNKKQKNIQQEDKI